MYKLLIGICSGGSVRAETVTSLVGAMDLLKQKGIEAMLSIQIGGYTAHNRNECVRTAQAHQATHLMFIDSDQTFPPSGILRLLDHDKEIVGANYNTRPVPTLEGKVHSTVKLADKEGNLVDASEIPDQLFKCYAVATGFMLIKMPVFDKLERPWFVAWETPSGDHRTEDVEFCKRAGEAGFDIWCSPTLQVGHIGLAIA